MAKRRKGRRNKSYGAGASKTARKQHIGKMSLGCLLLLALVAGWLVAQALLAPE